MTGAYHSAILDYTQFLITLPDFISRKVFTMCLRWSWVENKQMMPSLLENLFTLRAEKPISNPKFMCSTSLVDILQFLVFVILYLYLYLELKFTKEQLMLECSSFN